MKRPNFAQRLQCTLLDTGSAVLVFLIGICPLALARLLVCTVVFLARFLQPGQIRLVNANLAVAFPSMQASERRRLALASLRHILWNGVETIKLLRHPERISDMVLTPDESVVAPYRNRPCILCIPHLGNWEILAQAVTLWGINAAAVVAAIGTPTINKLLTKARTANGLQIINQKGAARKVARALQQNLCVGILIDQNISPRHGGIFIDFFGLPAPTSRLPASLARKLNIDVLVGACIHQPDGRFHLEIKHLPQPVADYEDDLSLTQDIMDAIQTLIRQHPEQYTWLYRRWRYIPDNAPPALTLTFPYYSIPRPYECDEQLLATLTARINTQAPVNIS